VLDTFKWKLLCIFAFQPFPSYFKSCQ
jgi:hypothetical protein